LNVVADIKIQHVAYKGGGPAIQDLLAGQIPLVANVVVETLPYIRAGRVRPIAVMGPKRTPSMPNVPTVSESLPSYRSGSAFWVLLTRAGTPAAVIKRLNADVVKAMQATEVRERFDQMDMESVGSSPAQCDAFLREQVKTWGSIVRASGAKAG
jgi:tripartite-type tricarboxylate transporter receptor subunit TctC